MRKRSVFTLLLALGVLFFLTGTPEARQYYYWDLGTFTGPQILPGQDQPLGEALGLNDQGQIVGWAWIWNADETVLDWEQHAVRWDLATRTFQDLGAGNNSFAYSINNLGQIVGTAATGGVTNAFFWDPANPILQPITNTLGGTQAWAIKINDQAQVVGYAEIGDTDPATQEEYRHAFLWDPVGHNMQDLQPLAGTYSWANDINSAGQIVGTSTDANGNYGAYLRDPMSGNLQPLGSFFVGGQSGALGLNRLGQVVGWSLTASGSFHAFLQTSLPAQPLDLGILLGNYNYSQAMSLNAQGQIVGECGINDSGVLQPNSAFLWTAGQGMQDLNAPGLVVNRPAGVSLIRAHAINRRGQIVGITSNSRPFLLTPITPIPHLQLLLLD
jgi:probable HAF family extracellular repeat protein